MYGDLGAQCVIGTAIVIDGNEAGLIAAVTGIQIAGVAVDGTHAIAKIPDVSITVLRVVAKIYLQVFAAADLVGGKVGHG